MMIIQIIFNNFPEELRMSAQHNTENLTVHCKVKDYAAWRTSFDSHEKNRLSAGLTNGRVYRRAEDQNDVVVVLDVSDAAKARTWFGSDEQKSSMEKSGVIGTPSLRFAA
jgi:hypothetical protein